MVVRQSPCDSALPLPYPNAWVYCSVPIIVTSGRFRIKVFGPPREHPPPHAHVLFGAEGLAIIKLGSETEAPRLWVSFEMTRRETAMAVDLVRAHSDVLRQAWEVLHAQD